MVATSSRSKSKKNKIGKFKVGSAILLTFINALPGYERKVASKLCADVPDSVVCKVFGVADFCIVQKYQDVPEPLSLGKEYRDIGVTNRRSIVCFTWADSKTNTMITHENNVALGFCFLKINRHFLQRRGIEGEQLIISAISDSVEKRSKQNPVDIDILGTLGWFEMILIVKGKRMADVLSFANSLRHLVIMSQDGKTVLPCFETTSTVSAIPFGVGGVVPTVEIGPKVEIETRVSCYSWADVEVQKQLTRYLGSSSNIAGTEDFVVKLKGTQLENLSEYVKNLWNFREATAKWVYKTHTSFLIKSKPMSGEFHEISPPKAEKMAEVYEHPRLNELRRNSETVHTLFLETYSKIIDILMDVERSSAVTDLLPFARKLRDSVLETEVGGEVDYVSDTDALGEQLEMLLFGLEQRCIGTKPCGLDYIGEPSYIGGAGGIQRILGAISSLPIHVIEQLGREWSGFFVFGFAQSYYRYLGGVLNMPTEALYRPDLWFGVFHEIGHEYNSQIDLMANPRLIRELERKRLYSRNNIEGASEIFSEIFGCLYGFGGDFDAYLKSTWQYLVTLPIMKNKVEDFFLRFLMTYIFMLEEDGKSHITSPTNIYEVALQLKEKLVGYVGEVAKLNDRQIHSICARARQLRVILDIIRDLIPSARFTLPAWPKSSSVVLQGYILLNVEDPVAFFNHVCREISVPSFCQVVAIILSLWNYQVVASQADNG